MDKLKEKGVSLLEPKNKGVFTVNFKHPILKDYKGNGRVITKSLGADVGKDYEKAKNFICRICYFTVRDERIRTGKLFGEPE